MLNSANHCFLIAIYENNFKVQIQCEDPIQRVQNWEIIMEKLYKIQENKFEQIFIPHSKQKPFQLQQQPPPVNKKQVCGKKFALFFTAT